MRQAAPRARPVFFNLLQIRQPVGAITSIAHRISGVLLAAGTPFAIYVLDLSLSGDEGYGRAAALIAQAPVKAGIALLTWALAHHALAGIRHLLSDVDVGSGLAAARRSAWLVNAAGVVIAVLTALALL